QMAKSPARARGSSSSSSSMLARLARLLPRMARILMAPSCRALAGRAGLLLTHLLEELVKRGHQLGRGLFLVIAAIAAQEHVLGLELAQVEPDRGVGQAGAVARVFDGELEQ